jgi:hypothetical protein
MQSAYIFIRCTPYLLQYSAGSLSLRVQQLDVKCDTKTKDNVFVTLVVSVQYQVQKDAGKLGLYHGIRSLAGPHQTNKLASTGLARG